MDSLGTGTGIGFQDWTVTEPESESKKLEPGTSGILWVLFRPESLLETVSDQEEILGGGQDR